MSPSGLLQQALDLACMLKETYTADNGISDLRPALAAYDASGNQLVVVLMNGADPAEVGYIGVIVSAAWQPFALALIAEGFVRALDTDDDDDMADADAPDRSWARDFASGDQRVQEAVIVAMHTRSGVGIGGAVPFTYPSAHTIAWASPGGTFQGAENVAGGPVADVLASAIGVEPMPGLPLIEARMEAMELLRDRGCLVAI